MLKVCPKCNTEHNKPGLYCSRSCANSRAFTAEAKNKKSLANKKFYDALSPEKKQEITARLSGTSLARQGNHIDKLMSSDFSQLNHQNKRKRVIIEQDFRCGCCGIEKWLDVPITFELEHIDGDNKNNERHNLIGLCPNCHSLSWSWRGRKNSSDGKTNSERFKSYMDLLKKHASVV